jgi:hypothetical protein
MFFFVLVQFFLFFSGVSRNCSSDKSRQCNQRKTRKEEKEKMQYLVILKKASTKIMPLLLK